MKLFFYQLKNLLKTKDIMFWSIAFPIILGTLFYVSFGTVDADKTFASTPVGIVWQQDNESFRQVVKGIEKEKNPIFTHKDMSEKEALKNLEKEKITAVIFVNGKNIQMKVAKSGIEASIVQCFLDQYLASVDAMEEIVKTHPEQLKKVVSSLSGQVREDTGGQITVKKDTANKDNYNPYTNYFYALIAMTCLFGSMFSQKNIEELQADQSSLGARRNIAPMKKTKQLLIDVSASWLIQFVELCITIFYLNSILGINFGDKIKYLFIVALAGSLFSNSFGMFVGTVVPGEGQKKAAIITAASLIMGFLGGLMITNMINIVEQKAPMLNRINPAALMVNAFHSLVVYHSEKIFYENMLILLGETIVFLVVSILVVRRKKYASI